MQLDLDCITNQTNFKSTVCIVGAGVAGLILARTLAKRGIEVHLLEGGGPLPESRSQELYEVQMAGMRHDGATEGRFRVFGGSSTRWGGQLLPYTPDIFNPPEGIPSAGWPLRSAEIEPYYVEVRDLMHVSHHSPAARAIKSSSTRRPLESVDVNVRFSKWAPFSKRNLASTLGPECLASERIIVFFHANLTGVEFREGSDRVAKVTAKNYAGRSFEFESSQFIICAGTIETCRTLLAFKEKLEPRIGKTMDNVGRYFHDHISFAAASVTGSARKAFVKLFTPQLVEGTLHTPKLEASAGLRSRESLLAVMAHFVIEEPEGSGIAAVRDFLQAIQRRQSASVLLKTGLALPQNSVDIAKLIWNARVRKRRAITDRASITLRIDCEQAPNAENRITLSEDHDAVGMPRAIIAWRMSEHEHRTIGIFAKVVDKYLNQLGFGPIDWNPVLCQSDDSWLKFTRDTFHPMGGTQMGVDPIASVVDSNLKVHGTANLFVASCSTFPAGGSSNPTFTLMALTLRLGSHLVNLVKAGEIAGFAQTSGLFVRDKITPDPSEFARGESAIRDSVQVRPKMG
jgi:choline dehydrogenase-like flavoprotein